MEIKKELVKREIAGDTILVPVGKTVFENNGLFALNSLASFIWDHLGDAESADDIVSAILEEYEIDRPSAERDVNEFLEKLRSFGIID